MRKRQGRELELRRIDAIMNIVHSGAKIFPGRRVRRLLYLMVFQDESQELGNEFKDFKAKEVK